VNVIPLEGGFCMVREAPSISKSTFIIYCRHRQFELTFNSQAEMEEWIKKINIVLSKTVLIMPYTKRLKMLRQQLGMINTEVAVTSMHEQI
jgi:hypothetical protein